MGRLRLLTKPIVDEEIKQVVERAQARIVVRENQACAQALDLRYWLTASLATTT